MTFAYVLALQDVAVDDASRLVLWIRSLPLPLRVAAILALALAAHGLVRLIRVLGEWVISPAKSPRMARDLMARRKPKLATLTGGPPGGRWRSPRREATTS
jgi:hypothetical protein